MEYYIQAIQGCRAAPKKPSQDCLPAKPIQSPLAKWLPTAAAVGCLGLTLHRALYRPQSLQGFLAILYPLLSDSVHEQQAATELATSLVAPMVIWTVEGWRGGRWPSVVKYPSVSGAVLQFRGVEFAAPMYYLTSALLNTGDEPLDMAENIDLDVARSVLPATVLGYMLPMMVVHSLRSPSITCSTASSGLYSWVLRGYAWAPLIVSGLTIGISVGIKSCRRYLNGNAVNEKAAATPEHERQTTKTKVQLLKASYATAFVFQAIQHLVSPTQIFPYTTPALHQTEFHIVRPAQSLAWYQLSTLAYGLHTVCDLRRRGYVTTSEAMGAAMGFVVGSLGLGVGAGYAGLWCWREWVLERLVSCPDEEVDEQTNLI